MAAGSRYDPEVNLRAWDERYRSQTRAAEDIEALPAKLVRQTAERLRPGKALDLACGAGRHALWLAARGWEVTAIDGAAAAIDILRERARVQAVALTTQVADLQDPAFSLAEAQWELVLICYYLQRNLMERAKRAVRPEGVLVAVVHTTEGGEEPTESRLRPGELIRVFEGWEILHQYEGKPEDPAHKRAVAEVVARRASHP